jgi:hypothetical protein
MRGSSLSRDFLGHPTGAAETDNDTRGLHARVPLMVLRSPITNVAPGPPMNPEDLAKRQQGIGRAVNMDG